MTAPTPTSLPAVLAQKWEEWKLSPILAGQSLAVNLLADADQHNRLDLSNPMGVQEAEDQLQQLFLQSPARSDRVLQAAVEMADSLGRVADCESPEEAANLLLQALMLALGLSQDPPPLDRE